MIAASLWEIVLVCVAIFVTMIVVGTVGVILARQRALIRADKQPGTAAEAPTTAAPESDETHDPPTG